MLESNQRPPPCKLGQSFPDRYCPVGKSRLYKRFSVFLAPWFSCSVLMRPAPVAARLQHALQRLVVILNGCDRCSLVLRVRLRDEGKQPPSKYDGGGTCSRHYRRRIRSGLQPPNSVRCPILLASVKTIDLRMIVEA